LSIKYNQGQITYPFYNHTIIFNFVQSHKFHLLQAFYSNSLNFS